MGLDLYTNQLEAKAVFEEADSVLGFPLSRLCLKVQRMSCAKPSMLSQP